MSFDESVQRHWEYIRDVIRDGRDEDSWIHLTIQDYLTIIGYHYKTAMKHGYKHGVSDSLSETKTKEES